ncbi:MAG: hypothetical protein M9962_02465 [Oligoflexia bacterium]|nr:hypothetical protein [Oligoflexia bacterium]
MDFTRIRYRHLQLWKIFSLSLFLSIYSCGVNPKTGLVSPVDDTTDSTSFSNYIVVSSQLNQSVVLLDPSGNFVRELLVLDGETTDTPYGVGIYDSSHILVPVDGVDRVMKIDLSVGKSSAEVFILNSNLSGNIRNLTRLVSGDILVVETSAIEKFNANGVRITSGGWPKTLLATSTGLEKLPGEGFVLCATGTKAVRTYDDSGTQIATASNGALNVNDCAAASDGRIAAAYNGAGDTVRIYTDSTLASVSCNYLGSADPDVVAFRPNGNLLIADGTANIIYEIDENCNYIGSISSPSLATPTGMRVLP